MDPILAVDRPVYFQEEAFASLLEVLDNGDYSNVFVLTDSNTAESCLPVLKSKMESVAPLYLLSIEAGEAHKDIDSCMRLWQEMSDKGGDRNSLLLNLGGGVVTDLGGFVACVFKRGIDFVHVPTSLLAMVDAAIGGKTGIDLGSLKNQLGIIRQPEMVLIHTDFLKTLPERHYYNGMAEMWKHGLIRDKAYWEQLKGFNAGDSPDELVHRSVEIKAEVVNQDPEEKSLRKILNFGHTLGHAIESYFLMENGEAEVLHGEAIAAGMIMESFLSTEYSGLNKSEADGIASTLLDHYPRIEISDLAIDRILELLKHDKKNRKGQLNFVLLQEIGTASLDHNIPLDSIKEAFAYYKEF